MGHNDKLAKALALYGATIKELGWKAGEPLIVKYVEQFENFKELAWAICVVLRAEEISKEEEGKTMSISHKLCRHRHMDNEEVLVCEKKLLISALEGVIYSDLGTCNDTEKARGYCGGHPVLPRLPCPIGAARSLLHALKEKP